MGNLFTKSLNLYDGDVVQPYPVNKFRTVGIAIDSLTSNLYVCDHTYDRVTSTFLSFDIRVFSSDFKHLFTFSHTTLYYPWGICISNNRVFVTEYCYYKNECSVFTLEGNIISKFKTPWNSYWATPSGIAVYTDGDMYLCDEPNHSIFILTHDGYYRFAQSNIKRPRDVKINNNRVIVLDQLDGQQDVLCEYMVLSVFSKNEELLSLIPLGDLCLVKFFQVTPDSNFLLSSLHHIMYVSYKGDVLERFDGDIYSQIRYQPGIVLDNKKMEIVGLLHSEGKPLSFYRYQIKDLCYYRRNTSAISIM